MTTGHETRFDRGRLTADILAFDRLDKPVLLVEIKARHTSIERGKERLAHYLQSAATLIPFGMIVTERSIQVFRWDGQQLSEPVFESSTAKILSVYDPEFSQKQVFEYYMITLVEAWLHDVAYQWKSEMPPGYSLLEKAGIAQQLQGGTTRAGSLLAS